MLESRTLFASTTSFSANIDFQPGNLPAVAGFVSDSGASFAARGRGLHYGWDADLSSAAVDRNGAAGADAEFDTFIASQAGNGDHSWQIAVPNGQYRVRIVLGDPESAGSFDRVDVDGSLFVKGKPTAAKPWVSVTRTVTVTSGRLTVSNATDALNNALDFITIGPVSPARALSAPIPGDTVQAHGGSILYQDGVYYWYGEDKDGPTTTVDGEPHVDVIGISVYTSTDLTNWTSHGLVLAGTASGDLAPQNVLERPKVIYNATTHEYVMWMHVDNATYTKAEVATAVSKSPLGPFVYQGAFRPLGLQSRDMTVFQDTDGTAYLVFATDNSNSLRIAQMTPDDLGLTGAVSTPFTGVGKREAPEMFKHDGKYYLLTSGATWFTPNAAMYAVSSSPMGKYTVIGDPISGSGASTTFDSQGAFAMQIPGTDDLVLLADQWNPKNLGASTYAWMPMAFDGSQLILEPPTSLKVRAVS